MKRARFVLRVGSEKLVAMCPLRTLGSVACEKGFDFWTFDPLLPCSASSKTNLSMDHSG